MFLAFDLLSVSMIHSNCCWRCACSSRPWPFVRWTVWIWILKEIWPYRFLDLHFLLFSIPSLSWIWSKSPALLQTAARSIFPRLYFGRYLAQLSSSGTEWGAVKIRPWGAGNALVLSPGTVLALLLKWNSRSSYSRCLCCMPQPTSEVHHWRMLARYKAVPR